MLLLLGVTIYSRYGKRVLLSAFAGLFKTHLANPSPRKFVYLFELQVFSNEIIMIIHTTAPVYNLKLTLTRWPCLDCQFVLVFKTYLVVWQEIMLRQSYGTYISISRIETIRKTNYNT